MVRKKLKIYIASSVGIDYFFFLKKTIEIAGYNIEPIYLITEKSYRKLSKYTGLMKVWLRIQMYIIYPLQLILKALTCKKESLFVISSNTFFAPLLTKIVLRLRGIKVIHLLYDLFPDALEIAGNFKDNNFWMKSIGNLMKLSQKHCEATVYLGEYLKLHAERRWGKPRFSKVIDISTDLSLYKDKYESQLDDEKLIIHYGGQLGHLHDATSIIESVKFICQSDISSNIEFNFYVSGAQAVLLENSLKEFPVKIISAVPSDIWRKDILSFHIGLVSLSPGGASVCLPSKTYGMMAGGLAILSICPEWSDLATLIKSNHVGWVVNNSAYSTRQELFNNEYLSNIQEKRDQHEITQSFYKTLKTILSDRTIIKEKRRNSYTVVRKEYNIVLLSSKWEGLIEEVYEN